LDEGHLSQTPVPTTIAKVSHIAQYQVRVNAQCIFHFTSCHTWSIKHHQQPLPRLKTAAQHLRQSSVKWGSHGLASTLQHSTRVTTTSPCVILPHLVSF